jgi:anti-anti-sigma factor
MLSVDTVRAGATVLLGLEGEIDLRTVPLLRTHLAEALSSGRGAVVVDLRGVSFIDSTGLATLLNALRRLTRARRRLLLVAGEGPVTRMLRLTGLEGTFALCASPAEALEAGEGDVRGSAAV